MASEVIQFREDPEAVQYLRDRGINPHQFAREAFEATLRKLRTEEKVKHLEDLQVDLPCSLVDMIRDDRDR